MNFNSVTAMGRLAADPDFTKGTKEDGSDDRAWGRLAINRPGKDGSADFVPICAWGARARVLADWGKKGKVLLVLGSLRTNNKQRPDGSYDNYTEISVAQIVLGPNAGPKDTAPAVAAPSPAQQSQQVQELTPEMVASLQLQLAALLAQPATQPTDSNPFAHRS